MKHSAVRELFKYWNDVKGRRIAPDRDDIDPAAIRRILADTFILSVDGGMGHPFRLAGTRVCAIFGRELKSEPMMRLWDRTSRPLVRDMVSIVTGECIGVSAGATGHTTDGLSFDLEILVLPLSNLGSYTSRAIGVLVPTAAPYWLGIHPVTSLTLGTLRYVGEPVIIEEAPRLAASATPETVPVLAMPSGGKIRRGLVVYDGGRGE